MNRFSAALIVLALPSCATSLVKEARFVEDPFCTLLADGVRYRFHADPGAWEALRTAAARWRQTRVHLTSKQAVEFQCLRRVKETL